MTCVDTQMQDSGVESATQDEISQHSILLVGPVSAKDRSRSLVSKLPPGGEN